MSIGVKVPELAVADIGTAPGGGVRRWIPLLALAAGALALYAPLVPGLVHEWAEFPNLSHGFAIPFIAAYLVWSRRDQLRAAPIEPSAWGLAALLPGLAALVVGVLGDESFLAPATKRTLAGAAWEGAGVTSVSEIVPARQRAA